MKVFKLPHFIKSSDFKTVVWLLIAFIGVTYLLPNKTVDSWNIFNPQKFAYLILTLATLEFFSYVATQILGPERGILLAGFFGGLISSTAVLVSMAKRAVENPSDWRIFLAAVISAKIAALLEVLIIVSLAAPVLLTGLISIFMTPVLIGVVTVFLISRKNQKSMRSVDLTSPINWLDTIRLAALIGVILAVISIAKSWFGEDSTQIISFITGFFELHGVTMANATLLSQNQLSLNIALESILLATIGSLVAKVLLAWTLSRGLFSRVLTLIFAIMAVAVGVAGIL